jgi:protein gp37
MTKIPWTEETWNPVVGCSKVSPGCKNCYAEKEARRQVGMGYARHLKNPDGNEEAWIAYSTVIGMPGEDTKKWNGVICTRPEKLSEITPRQKPKMIFVCSMGDLFHPSVPVEFQIRVLNVIERCPQHTFQILTKRPERAKVLFTEYYNTLRKLPGNYRVTTPFFNIWLGVSAENQEWADKRIPILLQIPAAVRFVSLEPLLGSIDLTNKGMKNKYSRPTAFTDKGIGIEWTDPGDKYIGLDWVIIGAESKGAYQGRECKKEWIDNIVGQLRAAGVPGFVKQIPRFKSNLLIKEPKMIKHLGYPQQYPK